VSGIVSLIRPEIREMRPYRSAQFEDGCVRLNANESPWRPPGDTSAAGLNWYPAPRPAVLTASMARHYGVSADRLLVTRGSSEAIDVIIRAFCRAGIDEIVICPPTFGMYETYAQIQGAGIRRVPLLRAQGYQLDVDAILRQWTDRTRVVFVCSPNNPTGNSVPPAEIRALAAGLRDRGVVVLDAAYAEFSSDDQSISLQAAFDNVIALRTLSKAMSLAGVRCGALIADPDVVALVGCVLPPYTFATACTEAVMQCLSPGNTAEWRRRQDLLKSERERLARALRAKRQIRRVWPSEANFLLVEAENAPALVATARAAGILLRDFSWDADLPGCVRITVGDPAQNDLLLKALS